MTDVEITRAQHIVQIRFNRPEKKNALLAAMFNKVAEEIELAEADLDVHAIVFQGAGGNFTSGNDLAEFPAEPPKEGKPTPPSRLIHAIANSTVPMVAAVNGVAAGMGATMLLHFDSVVVADDAKILMPFVNLALVPEGGSSMLLPKMMGYTRAAELLLRGKPITGQQAAEFGIASQVTPSAQVDETALAIATEFAQKPPKAMRKSKQLLKSGKEALIGQMAQEEKLLFECFASQEHMDVLTSMRKR